MQPRLADLWKPSGTVGRQGYIIVGFIGFAIKHNIDRLVATLLFHRKWNLFNYWFPLNKAVRVTQLTRSEAAFLATMVAISLPFVWLGVAMTVKRLRSARLPLSLILLFFIPFLNLAFFLLLCLLPERNMVDEPTATQHVKTSHLARIVPESALGSAVFSLLFTVPLGLAFVVLGTRLFLNYGWGLFVAVPFTLGFAAAFTYGIHQPRSLRGCIGVACLSNVFLGVALLGFAFEGIICLIMAMPIALPLACFGGILGYLLQHRRWVQSSAPAFLSALLLFVPGVQGIEHLAGRVPPVYVVRSAIDIQAPPEKVWRQVVAFNEIGPPTEWIFRAGVAYPIRAEISGSGPGAERHCVFSTGAFVEPIQIWDEPHRLKFSVTANPAPMQEWTPYSHIDPPHLHGFLRSNGGQFLLTPLPNGATRLEGTTWYVHGLWPSSYWRIWSDAIIHQIHTRVLRHIRDQTEARAG
jgi:uncharacterized membrane protein YhaH (DUF805 family)